MSPMSAGDALPPVRRRRTFSQSRGAIMALPVLHRDTPRSRSADEPLRELEQIQQQTFQLLQSALGGMPFGSAGIWAPPVDIEEDEDSWIIEAEIPGAKADDVNIEVHDNEIEITGEIVERERKGIVRRRSRRVGRFEYRVTLPGPIDPDGIDASLDGGILTLVVRKPEDARPRRVEINSPKGAGAPEGNGASQGEPAVTA
jgi:HSP20 family protein